MRDRADLVNRIALGSLGAIGGGISLAGYVHDNPQAKEAASVMARSLAITMLSAEALNLSTLRKHPASGQAGQFYRAGLLEGSLVSRPTAAAWTTAAVIGETYPGWLTRTSVYGLASTTAISRIVGERSFPSGVVLGSVLGFAIGRGLYRRSHRRHGATDFASPVDEAPVPPRKSGEAGPPDAVLVPLDSWVYPALELLGAAGLIPSQMSGLRPWTRGECIRQMREAESLLATDASLRGISRQEAAESVAALQSYFSEASRDAGIHVESVYIRQGAIGGSVLTDGYHFGQTWTNDFGRPFGEGGQTLGGLSLRAGSGRFFAYYRGEYQRAPSADALSVPAREFIAGIDQIPMPVAEGADATNRFRALEAYVGMRMGPLQLTAGKSAMHWGPTYDAPLSFSRNAEPTQNARLRLAEPIRLPGILRHLGKTQAEFVIGKLGGHSYTWRPWFNAQKISFKLTGNLEMGFTRWSIFWGEGHPITLRSFARNFVSTSSQIATGFVDRNDPGDRKGGFDFKYRIPGLRKYITLYSDSYSDDDPSPLAAPRRAAIHPGIHFTQIPGLPKFDMRIESPNTTPMAGSRGPGFIYFNNQYRSGNTNHGFLLGNAAGRSARVVQGWLRYRATATSHLELSYRHRKVDSVAFTGGGTQNTASLRAGIPLRANLRADFLVQFERWKLPPLADPREGIAGLGRNLSGRVELTFTPDWRITF